MIVVRKEDQPKIILLGILLLVAVTFVVRTGLAVIAKRNGTAQAQAAPPPIPTLAPVPTAVDPVQTSTAAINYLELPSPSEADPFRAVLNLPGQAAPNASIDAGSNHFPPLPGPNGAITPVQPGGAKVSIVAKTITLNGIIGGNRYSAMVTVEGQTESLDIGQSLQGFHLAELTDTIAVFTTRQGVLKLRVGDSRTAPIG